MLHDRELIWLLVVVPALSNSKASGSRVFDASDKPNLSSAKDNFVHQDVHVSATDRMTQETRTAPPSWPHKNLLSHHFQASSPTSRHYLHTPITVVPTQSIVSAPSFQPVASNVMFTALSTFTTLATSSAFDSSALSYSVNAPPQDYPTLLPVSSTSQEDPEVDTETQVNARARGLPIVLIPVLITLVILLFGMYKMFRVWLTARTKFSSTGIAVELPKGPDLLNPLEIARSQNIEKERAPRNDRFFESGNILHDINHRAALSQHRKVRTGAFSTSFFTTAWQKLFKFRPVSSPPNGNDIECATISDQAGPTVAMDQNFQKERGQPISETQPKVARGETPSNVVDPLHPMAISKDAASGSGYIVRDVPSATSRGSRSGSSTSISDGQILRSSDATSDVFNPRLSKSSIHSITNPFQNPNGLFLPPPELRGPNLPKVLPSEDENLVVPATALPSGNTGHSRSASCTSGLIGTLPEGLNGSTAVAPAPRASLTLADCTNTVSSDSIVSSYAPLLDEFPSVPSQVQVGNRDASNDKGSGGALTGINYNESRVKTLTMRSVRDENFIGALRAEAQSKNGFANLI